MAGTKAAAESLLRELPSVLGACVHEDVNGHPREVHILVRSGPDLRNLSHDIRDLLEEHLSVPVDQRVISIAQLAASAEDDVGVPTELEGGPAAVEAPESNGADLPSIANAGMPPAPATSHGDVHEGTGSSARASSIERPREVPSNAVVEEATRTRLRLQGVETRRQHNRVTVTVRLGGDTTESRGEATEPDVGNGRARAAVRATLEAATAAVDNLIRLELEGASVTRVLDRELVLVSLVALSPLLGRRPRMLVGAQPVEGRVEMAAVLAALKASNRTLFLALATTSD